MTLPLGWGAVASSGDYERSMVVDGVRYGHILDPRTGWPVRGLRATSVVASHCLVAGTLSTIAMLKGEAGAAWLESNASHCLYVTERGRVGGSLVQSSRSAGTGLRASSRGGRATSSGRKPAAESGSLTVTASARVAKPAR